MKTQNTLYHLTLLTGHVAQTPKVPKEVIELLIPLVKRGGGKVPVVPWEVMITPLFQDRPGGFPGAAAFSVTMTDPNGNKVPLAHCVTCWKQTATDRAWDEMARLANGAGFPTEAELQPRQLPWLAVCVSIEAIFSGDADMLMTLADFEKCMAWTLIEQWMR